MAAALLPMPILVRAAAMALFSVVALQSPHPDVAVADVDVMILEDQGILGIMRLIFFDGLVRHLADRSLPVVNEDTRSEAHTSDLQSLMRISYAVFCLKKKNKTKKMMSLSKYK